MSASAIIKLDTTPPTLAAEFTQDPGDLTSVALALATDDAIEVRVWGAIDPTNPVNADYAESQGDAPWIDFSPSLLLRAPSQGGRVYVQARDEVWNESAPVSFLVETGVTPPEPPVTPRRPSPPAGPVRSYRTIKSRSVVHVGSRTTIQQGAGPRRWRSVVHAKSQTAVRGSQASRSRMSPTAVARIRRDMRSERATLHPVTETAIHRRSEGPGAEEELDLLGLI